MRDVALDAGKRLRDVRQDLSSAPERPSAGISRPGSPDDLFAHMVLAAVNEAALFIARADDPEAALETGRRAVDELIDRLTTRQLD